MDPAVRSRPLQVVQGTDESVVAALTATDVTGERMTFLTTGKCVAACWRAVLRWAGRAARYVLCIRKEVPAMFTHRQTPPEVAL